MTQNLRDNIILIFIFYNLHMFFYSFKHLHLLHFILKPTVYE